MKKLLLALALFSTQLATSLDWNNPAEIEAAVQELRTHYEKSGQKAIMHSLYEDEYGKLPDYIGVTLISSIEKFAFEYIKQHPNAIKKFFLHSWEEEEIDTVLNLFIHPAVPKLRQDANKIGLNVTDEQLETLAIIQLSMLYCYDSFGGKSTFYLFREIVEYAYQKIQK